MRRTVNLLFAALPAIAFLAPAAAQPVPSGPQVSAAGHVRVQRPPTHMRMYLQISGRGKTLEEALAALKERREAVAAQLEKLGAEKSSIVFSPPGIDDSAVQQQRRMEMMIAQRLRGGGAKKGAKPAKPPVGMVSLLTVQWPLKADNPEKLLLAVDDLREKIKAADFGGGKDAPKLSPEEQEVAEEMAAEAVRPSSPDEETVKPNEPRFVFVAKLAEEDRKKALAEAFAKAKAQAAELAKAAGAELGQLTSLSGGDINPGYGGYGRSPFGYNRYANAEYEFQQAVQAMAGEEQRNESMSLKPDNVGFDFTIQATFALR